MRKFTATTQNPTSSQSLIVSQETEIEADQDDADNSGDQAGSDA